MPHMHRSLSSTRLTIAKNTSAQFIGRIISSLSTVILTFYIARKFGSVGYGEFVKITTFVSFFYLLADFGFNAIYIQKSTLTSFGDKRIHDPQWNMLLFIRIVLSVLLLILALVIIWCIPISETNGYSSLVHIGIILLLPTILFQALITTINGLFQKILRYEWSAISVIFGSLSSILLILLFVYNQSTSLIQFSLIPLLVGSAVTTLVAFIFVRMLGCVVTIERSLESYKTFIYATIPLGLTLLFNVIYFHVDSIVMTFSRSTSEVGIYGLAYKVFELLLVFPTFFMNSLYPMFVIEVQKREEHSHAKLLILIKKSATVLLLASVALSVMTWIAAPYITYIKHDFFESIYALRILLLGIPFFYLSSLTMWILIAVKKQHILAWLYGITMLVNIGLNILFVPIYGYTAAAWITVVSEAMVLIASSIVVKQSLS